jgi:uncharacterized protein YbbK (DUF523 family)
MAKPIIVISRCLGFDACRYDGSSVQNEIVNELSEYAEIITVCPETDIGMGVPRKPVNLHQIGNEIRVIQVDTLRDYTKDLIQYAEETLDNLVEVDVFILKSRSPSCGLGSSKLLDPEGKKVIGYINGVFSNIALEKFPSALFLDEERLNEMGLKKIIRKIM